MGANIVFVLGTFDTKGSELHYVADILRGQGLKVMTVDVSSSSPVTDVDIDAYTVASAHPDGRSAVFSANDRGVAVTAMADAAAAFFAERADIAAIMGLGGSGGTTIVTAV